MAITKNVTPKAFPASNVDLPSRIAKARQVQKVKVFKRCQRAYKDSVNKPTFSKKRPCTVNNMQGFHQITIYNSDSHCHWHLYKIFEAGVYFRTKYLHEAGRLANVMKANPGFTISNSVDEINRNVCTHYNVNQNQVDA